jgi:hypothetical protein
MYFHVACVMHVLGQRSSKLLWVTTPRGVITPNYNHPQAQITKGSPLEILMQAPQRIESAMDS